jgi:hypothetical protein
MALGQQTVYKIATNESRGTGDEEHTHTPTIPRGTRGRVISLL